MLLLSVNDRLIRQFLVFQVCCSNSGLFEQFLLYLWKLLDHLVKMLLFESQSEHFTGCDTSKRTILLVQDVILTNHLTLYEDSLKVGAKNFTLCIHEDFPCFASFFVNYFAFLKAHRFKFVEIVEVESVRSVLQKGYHIDEFLIAKL